MSVEANEANLGQLALRFLKMLATVLERLGWLLIFVGFPMGNTTVGLAVLFLGALGRLVTRQPFSWGIPLNDRFYLWAGIFLGITVLSALGSGDILVGLSLSLAFFLMFFLLTRGSSALIGPKPSIPPKLIAYIVLISGLVGSTYAMYTYFGLGRSRAIGIATSVNGLGTVSAFVAILALSYALHTWKLSKVQSRLSLITSVAAAGALVFSFSRGAWLGFAFSLLLFIVLQLMTRRVRWTTLAIILLVVSLGFGTIVLTVPRAQQRLFSSFKWDANMDRVVLWEASLRMIRDKPLLGFGGGSFPDLYDEYRVDGKTTVMAFAHNIVLQTAVEYGLLGLAAFIMLVGTAIARGWAIARRGSLLVQALYSGYLGILVHEMVDNLTHGMDIGGLFWLVTGLLVHLHWQMTRSGDKVEERRS